MRPRDTESLAGSGAADLQALAPFWDDLPPDEHLKDSGHYRSRRQSSFVVEGGKVNLQPHRAHWQPIAYNALHGGIERWFSPISGVVAVSKAFEGLLLGLGKTFDAISPATRWFVEAHQFRIDTAEGIGRPTPEGAHRDGVDFVAIFLVQRRAVKGGETRVFEADGPAGVRFTIAEPWTLLMLDDSRVIHETTPIQPDGEGGVRDTLVVTFRAHGFQAK